MENVHIQGSSIIPDQPRDELERQEEGSFLKIRDGLVKLSVAVYHHFISPKKKQMLDSSFEKMRL